MKEDTMKEVREELARIRKAIGPMTRSHADPFGANLAHLAEEVQRLCAVVDKLAEKIEEKRGGRIL